MIIDMEIGFCVESNLKNIIELFPKLKILIEKKPIKIYFINDKLINLIFKK